MDLKEENIINDQPEQKEPERIEKKIESKNSLRFVFNIILSTCVESTAHGISPIIKRENLFIRLIWLLCLLGSAGTCAYMIALSILGYHDYETVSKTNKVHLILTDYPAITICNFNPYLSNTSVKFVNEILAKNNFLNPNNITTSYYNLTGEDYPFLRYVAGTNAKDTNRSDSFRKSLGPQMSDMLFSCLFNLLPCTSYDFFWFFDSFYGNCFTFNSGKDNKK